MIKHLMIRTLVLLFMPLLLLAQGKKQEFVSLLTNMDVQIDMTDAVNNMYNFKFPQAEAEFINLRNKFKKEISCMFYSIIN